VGPLLVIAVSYVSTFVAGFALGVVWAMWRVQRALYKGVRRDFDRARGTMQGTVVSTVSPPDDSVAAPKEKSTTELDWLPPPQLTAICESVIKKHHKLFDGSPLKILTDHRDISIFIVMHHKLRLLLEAGYGTWKLILAAVGTMAVTILLGFVLNSWIFIVAILSLVAVVYLAPQVKKFETATAAVILSMELLADNVGGCAKVFPDAALKARSLLDENLPNDRTGLLDLYLPNRDEIPRDVFAALASKAGR